MHNCPSRLKIAGQNQYQKQLMTIVPCKTSDHIYQQFLKMRFPTGKAAIFNSYLVIFLYNDTTNAPLDI
jgi:hypothetical protein